MSNIQIESTCLLGYLIHWTYVRFMCYSLIDPKSTIPTCVVFFFSFILLTFIGINSYFFCVFVSYLYGYWNSILSTICTFEVVVVVFFFSPSIPFNSIHYYHFDRLTGVTSFCSFSFHWVVIFVTVALQLFFPTKRHYWWRLPLLFLSWV